jgi:hypothetical protein
MMATALICTVQNGERRIELFENFPIPDGHAEVALPIEVSPPRLVVNGSGSPRVVRVNCSVADGVYGAGEEINITVRFTTSIAWHPEDADLSDRWVSGAEDAPRRWALDGSKDRMYGLANEENHLSTQWSRWPHPTVHQLPANSSRPSIRLATGCGGSSDCFVAEHQSFYCKANKGALAITWNGHVLPNLYANLDQEGLKRELQTLPGKGAAGV